MENKVIPFPIVPEDRKEASEARHARYINILSKIASDIITMPAGNARMAACIVYKNDIVAFGANEAKTHPFQAKFGRNQEAVFLHAETCAIKNALRNISAEELSKSTLYICRVKFEDFMRKKLVFGLAKPCDGCIRCIHTFGIKSVVYSLDGTGWNVL
jgi:deoxycytidylate deaminase